MAGEKLIQRALQAAIEARAAKHVADPVKRAENLAKWQEGTPTHITEPTWYHGTSNNFDQFHSNRPAFVTQNPDFATRFSTKDMSMNWDPIQKIEIPEEQLWEKSPNVMPVHVRAKNPFDYDNPAHVKALRKELEPDFVHDPELKNFVGQASMGDWGAIESSPIQNALKALGHDSFYVLEEGNKNLAVYDPNRQFKSATGNTGLFDPSIPRIDENRGGEIREHHADGERVRGSVSIDDMEFVNPEKYSEPTFDRRQIVEGIRRPVVPQDTGVSVGGEGKRELGELSTAVLAPTLNAGPVSAGPLLVGVKNYEQPIVGYQGSVGLPEGFRVNYGSSRPVDVPSKYSSDTLSLAKDVLGTQVAAQMMKQGDKHGYGLSLSKGDKDGQSYLSVQRPPMGGLAVMGGKEFRFADGGEVRDGFAAGGSYPANYSNADYYTVYNAVPQMGPLGPLFHAMMPTPTETGAYDAYMKRLGEQANVPKPQQSPYLMNGPDVGPSVQAAPTFSAAQVPAFNFNQQRPAVSAPNNMVHQNSAPMGGMPSMQIAAPTAIVGKPAMAKAEGGPIDESAPADQPIVMAMNDADPAQRAIEVAMSVKNNDRVAPDAYAPTAQVKEKFTNRVPQGPDLNDKQRDLIARTVAAEASGKSPEEARAIAHVILNRIESGKYGPTPEHVLFAKNQFEPWSNPAGENYPMRFASDNPRYRQGLEALDAALAGEDITGGAVHFWAPKTQAALGRPAPDFSRLPSIDIGATRFHRRADGGVVEREAHGGGNKVVGKALQAVSDLLESPNMAKWREKSVIPSNSMEDRYFTGTSKDKDFANFNIGRHGAWFTKNPEEASMYALQNDSMNHRYNPDTRKFEPYNDASRVIPAFLRAENPHTGPLPESVMGENYKKLQSDWFDQLRAQGHDAWMPSDSPDLAVILKDPSQIKSSISNTGEFGLNSKRVDENTGGVVEREHHAGGKKVVDKALEALRSNSRLTQIATTGPSYEKGLAHLAREGIEGKAIDYGAGRGHGLRSIGADTFEPYPQGWTPTFTDPNAIPDEAYRRLLNLNVLNVLDPVARDEAVANMGRIIQPGGGGIISTRGKDVMQAKGIAGPEPMSLIIGEGDAARYQKGFTPKELREYVGDTLGPRFDVEPSDVGAASILFRRNREDGGVVMREHHGSGEAVGKAFSKYLKGLSGYSDAPAKRIADWQWRPLTDVAKDLNLTEIPPHVQDFGKYMQEMSQKAGAEGLSARDMIKGYTTTRASIQRRAADADKLRALGLDLPSDVSMIRPEGAWAEWLMTPMGKRYLDAASKGNLEGDAVADAIKIMSPFGRHETDIPDAMKWAAQNIPGREQAASDLVARAAQGASTPEEWRAFTSDIRGVGPSKSGFLASLYGRGDQPTLDARQIILNTGAPTKEAGKYIARGGGEGGVEAVNRLADRQRALNLDLPSELDPFYQHLAHHAIWDKASNEMTTHGDVIRAMREADGGAIVDHAMRVVREHHADGEAVGEPQPYDAEKHEQLLKQIETSQAAPSQPSEEAQRATKLANDIRAYERTMRQIKSQPEEYRMMTHGPDKPLAPVEIEGGYIGKRHLYDAPYDVAPGMSALIQTAYGLKTAPLYAAGTVFPPAAAAATAIDTGEAAIDAAKNIREGNYGSAAFDVGLGVVPGAAMARKPIANVARRAIDLARENAPLMAGSAALTGATLAPTEAEAAKAPRIKASELVPRRLTIDEIRKAYGPHTLANVSGDELERLVDAYSKIATPHSPGNQLPMFGSQIAEAYRPKTGYETSSGSYFNVKPSVPKEATTTVETPFHGPELKPVVNKTWDQIINEYYGSPMISIGGDRSDFKTLYGINEDALARPTKIHAGFKYMLEPNPHEIWGNADIHSGAYEKLHGQLKKAMQKDLPVLGVAAPMGPQSIDSARDFTNLLLSGMEGRGIHPENLNEFTKYLKSGEFMPAKSADIGRKAMEGFPGFENWDAARSYLLDPSIPGTVRREFAQGMDMAKWRDLGFPEVGSYRLGATDPYLRDVPANMVGGRLVEIDPKLFADASQKKIFEHFTYPSSTYGRYVADVPFVQRHYAFPDAMEQLMSKYNQWREPLTKGGDKRPPIVVHPFSTQSVGTSTARKMFEEQKQVQELNDRMRQAIKFGEGRRSDYGYEEGGSVEDRALDVVWKNGSK